MNTQEPVVFIVDDDAAVRESIMLMMEQEDISTQCFKSAADFLDARRSDCPGCVIIDVQMPEMDGLQLQAELSKRQIRLPVIFLTGHGNVPMSVRAMKAGAVDFLIKPVRRKKLLTCVQSALLKGEKMFDQTIHYRQAKARLSKLTEREREVMALAIQGCPNKLIAAQLGISHRTIEIHKSRIMQKTDTNNLLDLARLTQKADQSK